MNVHILLYYFDNMRAVLMLLVIVLHASCVFSTKEYWTVIHSSETTELANILFLTTKLFTISSFFIISGYFSMYSLSKYSAKTFLKKRVYRIGIPLLFIAFTFNSLQEVVLLKAGLIESFNLSTYFIEGEWKHHLWFLINLIFYSLFLILIKQYILLIDKKVVSFMRKIPFLVLMFFLPLLTVGLLVIGRLYPLDGIIDSSIILMYIPFFFFGFFIKNNKLLLKKFIMISPFCSLFITIFSIYIVEQYSNSYRGYAWLAVIVYIKVLGMWFSSSLFFFLFKKFYKRLNKVSLFLRDSSYSIYLIHHLWIVIIALILIKNNIGGILGLFILILSTILISMGIYQFIISKNKIFLFLFNGVSSKK